jgi:hypothetical protein
MRKEAVDSYFKTSTGQTIKVEANGIFLRRKIQCTAALCFKIALEVQNS